MSIKQQYYYFNSCLTALFIIACGCSSETIQSDKASVTSIHVDSSASNNFATDDIQSQENIRKKPTEFIPETFVLFDEIKGDLNNDQLEDIVYLIKGTDKAQFFEHEYRGNLDRNRRGIIILFQTEKGFQQILINTTCFSSENEDGGVYYAPELDITINKGKLFINYAHGRYGYWNYTFRYQNNDFALIGYDAHENRGPITQYITSINFLTKKELTKENLNKDDDEKEEVFKDTWKQLPNNPLIHLSEIKDFDELSF